MNSNKMVYVYLFIIGILMWNGFLTQRDQKLFNVYENAIYQKK